MSRKAKVTFEQAVKVLEVEQAICLYWNKYGHLPPFQLTTRQCISFLANYRWDNEQHPACYAIAKLLPSRLKTTQGWLSAVDVTGTSSKLHQLALANLVKLARSKRVILEIYDRYQPGSHSRAILAPRLDKPNASPKYWIDILKETCAWCKFPPTDPLYQLVKTRLETTVTDFIGWVNIHEQLGYHSRNHELVWHNLINRAQTFEGWLWIYNTKKTDSTPDLPLLDRAISNLFSLASSFKQWQAVYEATKYYCRPIDGKEGLTIAQKMFQAATTLTEYLGNYEAAHDIPHLTKVKRGKQKLITSLTRNIRKKAITFELWQKVYQKAPWDSPLKQIAQEQLAQFIAEK